MAAMALNREQIVALIDERLQVMVPGLEHSMGARLNVIINEANAVSQKLHADMERPKGLHEGELAKLIADEARVDEVVARQNTRKTKTDDLIEKLKVEFVKVSEASTNLEQRAAGVIQEQGTNMTTMFEDMRVKLAVTYDNQQAENAKVQTQLVQAEKLLKEATASSSGGAGTLRAPQLRKEGCSVDKLKESTDVIDFRQWVRRLELSLDAHYGWTREEADHTRELR